MSVIAIAMFTAPSFLASDTRPSDVPPSTFRILNDMGYQCWVAGAVIGAIVVWATSAVALRTGLLPRWFGWLSVLVGVVQLFAAFFFPILLFWLWILVTGALLTVRRADVTPAPAGRRRGRAFQLPAPPLDAAHAPHAAGALPHHLGHQAEAVVAAVGEVAEPERPEPGDDVRVRDQQAVSVSSRRFRLLRARDLRRAPP